MDIQRCSIACRHSGNDRMASGASCGHDYIINMGADPQQSFNILQRISL
jgi:hypothetical protein